MELAEGGLARPEIIQVQGNFILFQLPQDGESGVEVFDHDAFGDFQS